MSVSPTKRQNDKPVVQVRRHWVKFASRALIPGFLMVSCWLMSVLFFLNAFELATDLGEVLGRGSLLLSLAPTLWLFLVYYDWTNDYLVITRTRVVHYEQQYFFPQHTQIVPLEQVKNVSVYIPNVVLRWLNVGNIDIETASPEGLIHFDTIKDPQRVQNKLVELLERPASPKSAARRSIAGQADRLVQRQHHWIELVWRAWFPCVLLIVAVWLGNQVLLSDVSWSAPDGGDVLRSFLGAALLALSITWIGIVYHDWRKDHLVVTNERVIHYDQRYVFWRRAYAVDISDIAAVTARIPNAIFKRLDVGTVIVEKAGHGVVIRFDMVRDPRDVRNRILTLMGQPVPAADPIEAPSSLSQRVLSILRSVVPIYPIITPAGDTILHRHPVVLIVRTLVPGTLTALAWLGTGILLFNGLSNRDSGADLSLLVGLILLGVATVLTLWCAAIYHDWVNDYLSIGPEQIVHYEQHYILSHDTRVIPLKQVQNVRVSIPHIVFRWLNAGNVIIDTAGRKGDIAFDAVNDPLGIQDMIFRLRGGPRPATPDTVGEVSKTAVERFFEQFLPVYSIHTPEGWLICHRHPFVLVEHAFWPLLLGVVVLLGLVLLDVFLQPGSSNEATFSFAGSTLISVLFWGAALVWLLYSYLDWKDDYWIITDTHIIDVVARPFPYMSEDRRQARLQDIVNIRIETPSLWARMINMGNVFAETAGEAENFRLEQMMNPKAIQDALDRRRALTRVREQMEKEQQRLAERAELAQQAIAAVEQVQRAQWTAIQEEMRISQEEFQRNIIELLNQRKGKSS